MLSLRRKGYRFYYLCTDTSCVYRRLEAHGLDRLVPRECVPVRDRLTASREKDAIIRSGIRHVRFPLSCELANMFCREYAVRDGRGPEAVRASRDVSVYTASATRDEVHVCLCVPMRCRTQGLPRPVPIRQP